MTSIVRKAEIVRARHSGFELVLDGFTFPWHIEREAVEVEELAPGVYSLRIGILVDGSVVGADEFNEFLAEEADASRVRRADRRDLMQHVMMTGILR